MANTKSKPSPANIPESSSTVDVHIIDSTTRVTGLPASMFTNPSYKSYPYLKVPAYSFLITHPPSGQNYIFDLAVRKDWRNLPPAIVERLAKHDWKIEKNVADILTENNIDLSSINGIIWSHQHMDHTGDPSTFPSTTTLIVGPGFKEQYTPGYPAKSDSPILESDYAGREFRELAIPSDLKIGRLPAHDFFGDGSFYLLYTPGHSVGHLCGLTRTTANPSTFILMGGDVSHHAGEFRPSPYLLLPELGAEAPIGVSQEILEKASKSHRSTSSSHPDEASTQPFVLPSAGVTHDVGHAVNSIEGIQELDAKDNVFTVIAHDEYLLDVVGFFPNKKANEWKKEGWREKALWTFLWDFREGLVETGRAPCM